MILGRSIDRNARLYPERPAIVASDGTALSHAKLRDQVWRLADGLQRLALGRGSRVGILARNNVDYLTLYFACGSIGVVLVPLNFLLKPHDLETRISHAELDALFIEGEFLPLVGELSRELQRHLRSRTFGFTRGGGTDRPSIPEIVAMGVPRPPDVTLSPEDILYIGYTSGTTGPPKGALISHRAIVGGYLYKASVYGLTADDVTPNAGPYWHSAPRDFTTLAIYLGGTAIIPDKFNPETYLALVERYRVTNSFVVPTMLERLVSTPSLASYDTSSLRCLISGGAPLPTLVKERALTTFGSALSEFYGATETRVVTTISSKDLVTHDRSVGSPIPDVEIRVLDKDGNDVAAGVVGEVFIRGPGLFSGYWRDAERTRAAHRGEWFTLGDMGRTDERGFLYLVDRKQDMIVSGGENIFPNDIEECLLQHPGVDEAAVIGSPDDRWGEIVVAYIVPTDAPSSAEELLAFCRDRLPGYMKPRRIEFCRTLPRSATGKLLRRDVRLIDAEREARPTSTTGELL